MTSVRINGTKIEEILKTEHLTKTFVSERMGKANNYLGWVIKKGCITERELEKLAKYLYTTPEELLAQDPEPQEEQIVANKSISSAESEDIREQIILIRRQLDSLNKRVEDMAENLQVTIENAIITGFGVAMQETLDDVVKDISTTVYSQVMGIILKGEENGGRKKKTD